MPGLADHLAAAQNNLALAEELRVGPLGLQWSPVLTFYSALHFVDAYLATFGVHPHSHVARRAVVERDAVLYPILRDYRVLERRSREARYDLIPISLDEARALLDYELQRIASVIRDLLPATEP